MPYYGYGYGYGGYGLAYSWTYLLVLAGVIVCLIASAKVRSTYNRYSSVRSMSGMTGAQAAAYTCPCRNTGCTDSARVRKSDGSL